MKAIVRGDRCYYLLPDSAVVALPIVTYADGSQFEIGDLSNGTVLEGATAPAGARPEDLMVDGVSLLLVPDYAQRLNSAKAEAFARLAAVRYTRETAGITVAGAQIRTDRESQYTLAGALLAYQVGLLISPIDWKAQSGWVQVSAAQLAAIAQAVATHVQACFSHERALAGQIAAAATVTDVAAVDIEAGWPA